MPNICEYDNCGRQFSTIHDLVLHIEAIHIDFEAEYDPYKFRLDDEDFPTEGIPMSLILKYGEDEEIEEVRFKEERGLNNHPYYYDEPTPTYNDTEPSDYPTNRVPSKAYLYGPEGSPPQPIVQKRAIKTYKVKKFACPVIGCAKSYKNPNGMKYHVLNYHDNSGNILKAAKIKKAYKCDYCVKEYKTLRGLQSHHQAHKQTREHLLLQAQRRMFYLNSESRPGSTPISQGCEPDYAAHNNNLPMPGQRMMAEIYYPVNPEKLTYEDGVYYMDSNASAAGMQYQNPPLDPHTMQQLMQQSQAAHAQYNQQNASNILQKKVHDPRAESPDYEEFSFLKGSVSSETNSPTLEEITTWKIKNRDLEDGNARDAHSVVGIADGPPMDMINMIQQQQIYERHGYAINDRLPMGGRPEGYYDVHDRSEFDQLSYDVERVDLCES